MRTLRFLCAGAGFILASALLATSAAAQKAGTLAVIWHDRGDATVLDLTTGPGGRFIPSDDDPQRAAPGSSLTVPARRVEHVIDLRPDICSLDLNTMISGPSVVINTPKNMW